jgi:hypothetical protein
MKTKEKIKRSRYRFAILANSKAPDFLIEREVSRWFELRYGSLFRACLSLLKYEICEWFRDRHFNSKLWWQTKVKGKSVDGFYANAFGVTEAEFKRFDNQTEEKD